MEIFKEQIKYPIDSALILDEFKDTIQEEKPTTTFVYKELKTTLENKYSIEDLRVLNFVMCIPQ